MFARLYRPKNLICLVTATFGLFVFFQVYVLIPNTADRRKDLKRQDENYEDVAMEMHQAKKSRFRKNGQNKDLDLLENINRNVNKNKFGKSKFREALKPMYDAQNDEEGAPDEANIDALIKKRDRVFADTDEGGRADDTPRQAVLPVAPQDEKPRPPRGVEQFKPPQDVKPARLSGRYNIAGVNHIRESNDTEPLTIMLREIASRGNAKSPNTTVADVQFNKFSEACTVNVRQNPNRETPFKIYILNLPARYNTDLLKCVDRTHTDGCFKTSHCGLGPEMYNEHSQDFSARDTWQFSLEVIMHHKLLLSPYRTFNVDEADAIYVPYYAAADCFCSQLPSDFPTVEENIPKLIGLIRNQGPFVAKRQPYIMTLGKIEREHMTGTCPWLVQTMVSLEFTYIGIEQESNINLRYQLRKASPPLILAPYPSYGHLLTGRGKKYLGSLYRSGRPVFLLLAAGTRRSNYFRSQVLDQFKGNLTNNNFEKYMERAGTGGHDIAMVHYATPECRGDHNQHTLDWMKRSVFCLQPPGDSPTRKSIYDAIISGCIPVFFQQSEIVRLPFEAQLKYETFSVTIPSTLVNDERNLFVYLRATYTDATITSLQRHLKGVAQYFQYSFPISNDDHNDAVKLILDTIKEKVLGLV